MPRSQTAAGHCRGPTRTLLGERRDQGITNTEGCSWASLCIAQIKPLGLPGFHPLRKGAEWFSPLCCQPMEASRRSKPGFVAGIRAGAWVLWQDLLQCLQITGERWAPPMGKGNNSHRWAELTNHGLNSWARGWHPNPQHLSTHKHLCCVSAANALLHLCDEVGFRLKSSWLVMHSERSMFKLHFNKWLLKTPY